MKRIGFVGLGKMGGGMAGNLIDRQYDLMVYDVSEAARASFAGRCPAADAPEALIKWADVVFLSLPGSPEVDATIDAFLRAGVKGKYIVDCSTSYPLASIRNSGRIRAQNGYFLEAPLMGTPATARSGQLRMLAAGEKEAFEALKPILEQMSAKLYYAGGSGCGNLVKLSANYLTMSYTALYAEILPILEDMGVDYDAFFQVMSGGAADCGMLQSVVPKMHARNHSITFLTRHAMKDISYTKRLYADKGYPSPMLDACLSVFSMAKCMGYEEEDYTRIAEVMRFFVHTDERNNG